MPDPHEPQNPHEDPREPQGRPDRPTPDQIRESVRRLAQLVHAQMDGDVVLVLAKPAETSDGGFSIGMATIPLDQIRAAVAIMNPQPPVILRLDEAAYLARISPNTLKRRVNEGHYKKSVKRGKPLRFFRDVFIQELMRG